jgi:hypothetical protein
MMLDRSNLREAIDRLLEKYSIEEVVFTLYCYAEDQGRGNSEDSAKLKQQAQILSQTCDLLEENDDNTDNHYLIY